MLLPPRLAARLSYYLCSCCSVCHLALAGLAFAPLPGPELKTSTSSFNFLGLGFVGLACCSYPLFAFASLVASEGSSGGPVYVVRASACILYIGWGFAAVLGIATGISWLQREADGEARKHRTRVELLFGFSGACMMCLIVSQMLICAAAQPDPDAEDDLELALEVDDSPDDKEPGPESAPWDEDWDIPEPPRDAWVTDEDSTGDEEEVNSTGSTLPPNPADDDPPMAPRGPRPQEIGRPVCPPPEQHWRTR
eukprot:TRINITY_DN78329_c0_g1_i1.p1 TRINITY_DN78329_c0_g1~~TRINITY_DN78329_c0_g1_i1.p1  ORF type:complete len:252 (+),score=40.85 TRINITY_DN78329_c0_g1_i1:77-832(+)